MSTVSQLFPLYSQLPKFYINLESRTDRRLSMEQQIGDEFVRIPACNAKQLTAEELAARFDLDTSLQRYQVKLRKGQMGCTISHFQLYQQIVADNSIAPDDWVLIAEDDGLFINNFRARLEATLQALHQPRYHLLELVVLRYYNFAEFVDFSPEMYTFNPQWERKKQPAVSYANEFRKKLVPDDLFILYIQARHKSQYHVLHYDRQLMAQGLAYQQQHPMPQEQLVAHLPVTDGASNTTPASLAHQAYLEDQACIIFPNSMLPYSSGLYLIRKCALMRIVAKCTKPYWITDDFKAIVPLVNTAILSPNLARDYDAVATTSDIESFNPEAVEQANRTVIYTPLHRKQLKYLKRVPQLFYQLGYSNYRFLQSISARLQHAMKLRDIE